MSFLWYWPDGGWDFDKWRKSHDWTPIQSDQSGNKDPIALVKPGMTLDDWRKESSKWKKVSDEVLGSLSDGAPTNFRYEALGVRFSTDHFSMQRYRYTLTDDEWGYAWLLTPKKRKLANAAIIALHQTAVCGKDEPVGLQTVPDERAGVYYAAEMAARGFVVLAPDAIAFGERQSGHRNKKYGSADQFFTAQPHGSVMGKMGFDAARAVDLLRAIPDLNAKKIGCVGHSHGGYGTLFAMLADPRIDAGVISCGVSCLRDDPKPQRWWRLTSLIPRLGYFDGDMSQAPIDFHIWMAMVAPRPLMVIAGTQDTIFPNCTALRDRLEFVREVYKLHNAADALKADVFDGPHSFRDPSREEAYAMLERVLA